MVPMPDAAVVQPATRRADALVFIGITGLAFIVRLIYLLQAKSSPLFDQLIMDGRSYSQWADRIRSGDWPTAINSRCR